MTVVCILQCVRTVSTMELLSNVLVETFGCSCSNPRVRRRRSLRLQCLPPKPGPGEVGRPRGTGKHTHHQREYGGFEVKSDSDDGEQGEGDIQGDTWCGDTGSGDSVDQEEVEEPEWVMPCNGEYWKYWRSSRNTLNMLPL